MILKETRILELKRKAVECSRALRESVDLSRGRLRDEYMDFDKTELHF
jgi:hypothetical protein